MVVSTAFKFLLGDRELADTATATGPRPGPGHGPDTEVTEVTEPTAPVEPEAGPAEPLVESEPEPPVTLPGERPNGLQQSKWAYEFDPLEARRERGLPATYREAEEAAWLGQGTGGDWRKVEGGGEVAGKVWGGEVAGEVTGRGEVKGQVGEEVGGEVGRKVGREVGEGFSNDHPFVCFLLALGHNLVP